MAEIIRVDVVEHIFNPERDGRIRRPPKTPEEIRQKAESDAEKEQERARAHRDKVVRQSLVYSSMAIRKVTQVVTLLAGNQIDNSYSRQIFNANMQGNTRGSSILQNSKIKDRAVLSFYGDLINNGASMIAGFAINPILGAIQLATYTAQLGINISQQFIQSLERMRQYSIQQEKAILESEYKRNRLLANTFYNRGKNL
jgi:hypothetical protein